LRTNNIVTAAQKENCSLIIHGAAAAAAVPGAGLAQLPMADHVVIVPIQLAMVIALGKVFGIEVTESVAKSMVLTGAATLVGHATSQVLVAGITEAMGWTIANEFDSR
jgi:uncharacterized protein (DUF697 family)